MDDYISREAAVEALRPYKIDPFKIGFLDDNIDGFNDGIDTAISELSVMPAADVVEVVRCKDCKHWTGINCGYCEVWEHYISNQNYFCGSGEMGGDNG